MATKKETRKCPVCGKTFAPKAVNQKYCSTKCKRAAASKKEKAAKPISKKPVAKPATKTAPAKKPVAKKPAVAKRPDVPAKAKTTAKPATTCTRQRTALAKNDAADKRLPTVRGAICVQRVVLPKSASDKASLVSVTLDLVKSAHALLDSI